MPTSYIAYRGLRTAHKYFEIKISFKPETTEGKVILHHILYCALSKCAEVAWMIGSTSQGGIVHYKSPAFISFIDLSNSFNLAVW